MPVNLTQSVADSSMKNLGRADRAVYLLKVNMALSRATDEPQILDALGVYTQFFQPAYMTLCYVDVNQELTQGSSELVAVWHNGKSEGYDPGKHAGMLAPQFRMRDLWGEHPENIVYVGDLSADTRFPIQGDVRPGSVILIPLYSSGKYQGVIKIVWDSPRTFTEEEHDIYASLMQTISSVVASRRAYLAEQEARRENELLYRASQAINAAGSYAEIVQTVARLHSNQHTVLLTVWENYDYEQATYFEVVATAWDCANAWPLHDVRYPARDFPTIARNEISVIENAATDERMSPSLAAVLKHLGKRALINVPLCHNNRWIATLSFLSDTPREYSERDKRVAAGMGDLVLSAIMRIRLQAETEAARRQAETLARINAGLSQAVDEQEILAAVASLAESCGVSLSILSYADAHNRLDSINIVAMRSGDGSSPLPLSFLPITSFPIEEYPILHLAAERPYEPIFVEDVSDDQGISGDFARRMNWGAIIMIPLKTGDQWQGTLAFVWKEPRTFSPQLRQLFADIRPTAASVVKSRRAYLAEQEARRETEQRAREMETITRMSAAAASILNEHDLVAAVYDLTRARFKQHHTTLYLLDETGEYLEYAGLQDSEPAPSVAVQRISIHSERSLVARAGRTRQGVIVGDITTTPDYTLTAMLPDARSEMAVPMIVADRLVGVLDIQAQEVDFFNEGDIRVMATLADLIAVAIQNARLYRRAQVLAALEERNRLARELHDSVSQAIFGIALGARTARTLLDRNPTRLTEPLDYVLSLAEAALTEMRSLIFELRPETLENDGLMGALQKQAASLQARHNIQVDTQLCEEPDLPIDMKETLYRIAREALHNTLKHAHATHVNLIVAAENGHVTMQVSDNGQGFDPDASYPGHLGLQSMRERAARFGGTLNIESAPGSGTRILVQLPRIDPR